MLGGTLSTRTEIAGGSLPSDPVLISPRISRLYPSVPREHPRMSRFSSFSLTLSLPLSVAFLSQLLRETYFSLYNFTFRARCSSVSRVFREPGRKFPREEAQDYFSSAVPSAPSPLFARAPPSPRPDLKLLRLSRQLPRSLLGQVFSTFYRRALSIHEHIIMSVIYK